MKDSDFHGYILVFSDDLFGISAHEDSGLYVYKQQQLNCFITLQEPF